MKRFRSILLLGCLCLSGLIYGQSGFNFSNEPGPWRVGGGLGVNFGSNDYFGVSINPFLGYEVIREMEVGASVGYQYSTSKYTKQNLFNFGPYINYYPIESLFLRAQYEYYTGDSKSKQTGYKGSFDEDALWIGAGYRTPGPISVYTGLMYDVLYKSDSHLFSNGFRPIIGVSIGI